MKAQDYPENMKKYMDNMAALVKTHKYVSPEEPGSMPTSIIKDGKVFALLDTIHAYTCDIPHCQALFQMSDSLENGLSATYYPMLPMYSCNFNKELCGLCIHK